MGSTHLSFPRSDNFAILRLCLVSGIVSKLPSDLVEQACATTSRLGDKLELTARQILIRGRWGLSLPTHGE